MTQKNPPKTSAERQATYRLRKQQEQRPKPEQSEGTLPVAAYQHRVRELETQVQKLEEEKLRLYDLLEVSQANVQREQSLRLLPGPVADRGSGLAWWGRALQRWRRS